MIALIVEDEAIAARSLQRLLADCAPDIEVAAILPGVESAVHWLRQHPPPDVMFLDVQLSDGLSFDIFDTVEPRVPVIFTTAWDGFALRAFEVFGIDYLLKPIEPARLAAAIDKLQRLGASPPAPPKALARHYREATHQYKQRFLVSRGEVLNSIDVANVAYFAKELVVRLVARDGRGYALAQSLDELESMLDPARFFRLNRRVLASIGAIGKVQRQFKGRLEVELAPPAAEPVAVSQERAAAFREWLDR